MEKVLRGRKMAAGRPPRDGPLSVRKIFLLNVERRI
nr:MAG TPA: hypothetical protein [Caudoviricetes sp.]